MGKALFHIKKLIQSMLCKNDPKTEFFFQKKNYLAHLKDILLIRKTMIVQKKLFVLIKMRNLSGSNDLYNVQDVILLMVIIENRFQEMQNETGYNPMEINSASKLSSCTQRE